MKKKIELLVSIAVELELEDEEDDDELDQKTDEQIEKALKTLGDNGYDDAHVIAVEHGPEGC